MAEIALRQIRAVIAVCEEGSFTRAAARENATQSGISQHVAAAERVLGVKLFERSAGGVKPTPAGQRYYKHCIEAVGQLAKANAEVRAFASRVTGDLRIGFIPTLTRAALAPTLEQFVARYPDVRLHIIEGYSGTLTEMVQNGELDFAAVPAAEGRVGMKSQLIARDREMLLSNVKRGLKPFAPVRLKDLGPLKIILPGRGNVRRRNIEVYFETHGIEVEDVIEMDAMISTLQFVPRSDWVAILSGLICVADIGRSMGRVISPIHDPPLIADFVVISPARRVLSPQAQLFLECFETEIARIQDIWAQIIPPVVYPGRPMSRGPAAKRRGAALATPSPRGR
ncbi:MAG TPA: LysR family transcriptional regulator [Xanthobacteraceae bacterium]|jgi:LysR family tcuABC transcriptional regulator